ncbi:sulfatase-like hydrolase/transferase [Aquipseudomonas campi]|uniref:Sulfatase-like hydrolase/transferase n=1 Tax=Aquipseudomonas campi TaxID=2731681 RepID=A0A6M8FFP7_9GAMM|nr:sulfatase-like hydrolase/transferase [Pseudomonas campi]QKE65033.1 sulfatase-like hydrolase/transferase [Pseudomonas campi]
MSRLLKRFYRLVVLASLGMAFVGCDASMQGTASRPNILLILTDDLGNNDIASWGDGQAPTPTLDSLSKRSVRFRQHYTDSTCSASRAALLTGRDPVAVGFQAAGAGLSSDLRVLPEALQGLGYRTMHLGKWHVGEALEYRQIEPGSQGFDYWLGYLNHFLMREPGPDGQHLRRRPSHTNPWLQENGQPPTQYMGNVDDVLTDKAIELIRDSGSEPWFINLWLFAPHTPYEPSPEFRQQFPDTLNGRYMAVLKQLDHNVNRLLAELKARGLEQNTIVVFASDNGGANLARDNNFPFAGKKFTYREGGVRAPMLISWAGRYEDADLLEASTLKDLYPTLIALAEGEAEEGLEGRSLKPLMDGRQQAEPAQLLWAAEDGSSGMIYGLHDLLARQTYFRGAEAVLLAEPMSPPISRNEPVMVEGRDYLSQAQIEERMVAWETRVRRVPLTWQAAGMWWPAQLKGRDLQRAPIFGGYSIGLALPAWSAQGGEQVLVDQPGVWSMRLDGTRRLLVRHSGVEMASSPLALNRSCNGLVVSFNIRPAVTTPFPTKASARTTVLLNGVMVLDSAELLSRPSDEQVLANATTIGAAADGSHPFSGVIPPPLLVGKQLSHATSGYDAQDMLAELCPEK